MQHGENDFQTMLSRRLGLLHLELLGLHVTRFQYVVTCEIVVAGNKLGQAAKALTRAYSKAAVTDDWQAIWQ